MTLLAKLSTRLTLLLLLIMGIGFALLWWGFRTERVQHLREQVVSAKLADLTRLQAALNEQSELEMPQMRRLAMGHEIFLVPVERRPEIGRVPVSPRVQEVVAIIRERLGEATEVRMGMWQDEPVMWVKIAVRERQFWAGIRVRAPQAGLNEASKKLMWAMAGLMLLLIAAAAWLTHKMLKPLATLNTAIERMAKGETVPTLESKGVDEVRSIAERINTLQGNLSELESNRTLMLAGISHDMRTPLSRLRLQVQLTDMSESEKTEFNAELDELERHLNQFISFAKLSHQESLETTPVDMTALVKELAHLMQVRGRVCETTFDNVTLVGNRELIKRAIENLLENAYRYSDNLPVTMTLSANATEATLDIIDQGPGIPEEKIALLKQAFTRGDEARSGAAGTGLGLAIVERIMQLHGGKFTLSNSEDRHGAVASLLFTIV